MKGLKRKIVTGCGNTHLTAFFDKGGKLRECFYSRGSAGGCESSYTAISRLVSLALRNDIPADEVIDQLKSVQPCPAYRVRTAVHHDTSKGTACASAMGYALEDMIKEFNSPNSIPNSIILCGDVHKRFDAPLYTKKSKLFDCVSASTKPKEGSVPPAIKSDVPTLEEGGVCPECGAPLVHEGGCDDCKFCGWSRCG